VRIVQGLKVLCFAIDLQVFILKVMAGRGMMVGEFVRLGCFWRRYFWELREGKELGGWWGISWDIIPFG
jgi:hypothetical protein